MKQDLHRRDKALDAFEIVSSQVDDGPLTLMCESAFESAQFALMLVQAQSVRRGLPESGLRVHGIHAESGTVLIDARLDGLTIPVAELPVSCFTPRAGDSLVPFLVNAVSALLDVYGSSRLRLAA